MLLATWAAREPQMEQAAVAATKGVHTPAGSVTRETAMRRACCCECAVHQARLAESSRWTGGR
eukprot:14030146-Alexandrium_andersonii.AAC.1